MTEQQAIDKYCAWAEGEVGYPEGADNWTKYAEDPLLTKLLGWKPQKEAWCDLFTDEGFIVCFGLEAASAMTYQPIGKGSAACRYSAAFFKDNGAWSYQPQRGRIIFFISAGAINHQGVVVRVDGNTVYTVEGNSSDMVSKRSYSKSDPRIAGYGIPKWSVVSDEVPGDAGGEDEVIVVPVVKDTTEIPLVQRGDYNETVRAAQFMLIGYGYYCGGRIRNGKEEADGEFGQSTETATIRFQNSRGLEEDGKIGPQTWAALLGVIR